VTTQVSLSDQAPARPKALPGDVRSAGKAEEFYTVQIAAKTDRSVARSLVDQLLRSGYPAFIVDPGPDAVKPFYRVRFGSYESRSLAEKAGREYAAREGGDYLIVLSAGEPRRAIDQKPSNVVSSVPPAVAGYFYTVQVSVCQKLHTAENLVDTLRAKGFDSYVMTHETESGKKLYRVRMGRFKERAGAAELARAYQQQGGADFIIVRTADDAVQQSISLPEVEQPESKPDPVDTPVAVKAPAPVPEAETGLAATPEEQPEKSSAYEPVAPALQNSVTEEPLSENQAGRSRAVTKIYAYTDSNDRLNLTNAYAQIPGELIPRIQYISIFPVRIVSVPDAGNEFVIEVEGRRRRVVLSGIRLPDDDRATVSASIKELLTAAPLRLKYAPEDDRKDSLTGTLYYRSGTDLQIELVKRGLAYADEGTIPESRREDLRAAQQRARDIKSGIWSKSTP
jgi:cell division septation protein DedD